MKFSILIFTLLVFSGCANFAVSVSDNSKPAQPSPTIENSDASANNRGLYSEYQYDSALIAKLNAENERFRVVPDEFKSVDFKNYKYDFGRLKNGEYEAGNPDNPLAGHQTFSLDDIYFVDLFGDPKKEAILFFSSVGCGVSCDGGAAIIYFYSSQNGGARIIDIFYSGANAGGCSLKSFAIKDKKLYVEHFGRCLKDSSVDENTTNVCKFCSKDETHSVYTINKNGLKRESAQVLETETVNVMNSPAYVSINE